MGAAVVAWMVLAALPAVAGEPTFGGHIKGFAFHQVSEPHQLDRVGSRLQLSLWGGDGEPVDYFAAIDFEIDSRLFTEDHLAARGHGFDVYPVEIYTQLSRGPLELRIGQQFIFWGRMDLIAITDVITPWDYANMASEIEDHRMAPLAARLRWYIAGELALDLAWVPLFRPNRLPGGGVPASLGGLPVREAEAVLPGRGLADGELGARLSQSVSAWALDWAVAAYRGHEKVANVTLSPILATPPAPPSPVAISWQRSFDAMWMVGGDFAKALGPLVVRGEIALKRTEDQDGNDPTLRNSRVDYALGVACSLTDDVTVTTLYVGQRLLDFRRREERHALAELAGDETVFVPRLWSHQAYVSITGTIRDRFGAQLMALANLTYRDYFVLGFAWWDAADGLRFTAGAVGFGGAEDNTPFARQQAASRAFLELKYSF